LSPRFLRCADAAVAYAGAGEPLIDLGGDLDEPGLPAVVTS